MGLVEEFEELKPIIKDKWLNFYEDNLTLFNNINLTQKMPRPHGSVIIPIVILLEPKVKSYLLLFSMANPDTEKIVQLLGLDFNIYQMLESTKEERAKKKVKESSKNQLIESPSPLDEFRNKNL